MDNRDMFYNSYGYSSGYPQMNPMIQPNMQPNMNIMFPNQNNQMDLETRLTRIEKQINRLNQRTFTRTFVNKETMRKFVKKVNHSKTCVILSIVDYSGFYD